MVRMLLYNIESKDVWFTCRHPSRFRLGAGCFQFQVVILIHGPGAGYDQIDVHACTKRGITVSNTPNVVDDSTADTAMFLILGALRRLNMPMTTLRTGYWRGHPLPPLGRNPQGKTLGILGMGRIGRNLKRKAEAFDMRVIYHNRRKLSHEHAGGAEYVTFEDLLAQSDVVSVNLPLNVSTRQCFVICERISCQRQESAEPSLM